MSVLSDRDIRAELEAERVRIVPYDQSDLQPSSVDLHLDRSFRVFRNNRYAYIDVRDPQPDLTELLKIEDDEPFILHPGEFVLGQTMEWVELPNDLVARLEGKSSLGRLGLLIHSTAGYVDPGWRGNLTLELSNVANLPIALYYAMRIGQISFFRMSSPVDRPYGSAGPAVEIPGPIGADCLSVPSRLRRGSGGSGRRRGREVVRHVHRRLQEGRAGLRALMPFNDALDWSADLGGGTRVSLVQAGSFRSDAGALFGPVPRVLWDRLTTDEIDHEHRLLQALNCLLIETPAGRVLVETGIGERYNEKMRLARGVAGDPIVPAMRKAGFDPATVDVVAMSHLHFDHAGGLLLADGSRAFPRATIVAQRSEWTIAFDDNSRIVASYDQPELELVRSWGEEGAADGERELLPGVSVIPTGGHSFGHQGVVVRGTGTTLAFFGDLCMRTWSANPRWVTAFDDFPLDSVAVKGSLFARAADEGWLVALSHETTHPVGRLVRDRDRFRYEPI